MFNRKELKRLGKSAFKKNYWMCVLTSLVLGLLGMNGARTQLNINGEQPVDVNAGGIPGFVQEAIERFPAQTIIAAVSIASLAFAIAVIIDLFILNVIEVGGCRFFLRNSNSSPSIKELIAPFKTGNYMNVVIVQFCKGLFTFLWTLLFIIPGIVKAYEYYMIPYIMAEYPDMPRKEAFAMSKEMMKGNKWATFVMELSFIGWQLLSALTFGIVGVLWTNPYLRATQAELYLDLKRPESTGYGQQTTYYYE